MKEAEAEGAEEGMAVAEEGWVADQGGAAAAAAVAAVAVGTTRHNQQFGVNMLFS